MHYSRVNTCCWFQQKINQFRAQQIADTKVCMITIRRLNVVMQIEIVFRGTRKGSKIITIGAKRLKLFEYINYTINKHNLVK